MLPSPILSILVADCLWLLRSCGLGKLFTEIDSTSLSAQMIQSFVNIYSCGWMQPTTSFGSLCTLCRFRSL